MRPSLAELGIVARRTDLTHLAGLLISQLGCGRSEKLEVNIGVVEIGDDLMARLERDGPSVHVTGMPSQGHAGILVTGHVTQPIQEGVTKAVENLVL